MIIIDRKDLGVKGRVNYIENLNLSWICPNTSCNYNFEKPSPNDEFVKVLLALYDAAESYGQVYLYKDYFESYPGKCVSALQMLWYAGLIAKDDKTYSITEFGTQYLKAYNLI